jgi:hypothetical protein
MFTNEVKNMILDAILRDGEPVSFGDLYVALYDGIPGVTGTEIDIPRQPVTWAEESVPRAGNANHLEFTNDTGTTIRVSHLAVFDAEVGGMMVLSIPRKGGAVNIGQEKTLIMEAGDITLVF